MCGGIGGQWSVEFHLLAALGSRVSEPGFSLFRLSRANFICNSRVYAVDSLLVEDWEPAYGVRLKHPNLDECVFRPFSGPEELCIVEKDRARLIVSTAIHDEINRILADRVTTTILTDPVLEQIGDLTLD